MTHKCSEKVDRFRPNLHKEYFNLSSGAAAIHYEPHVTQNCKSVRKIFFMPFYTLEFIFPCFNAHTHVAFTGFSSLHLCWIGF